MNMMALLQQSSAINEQAGELVNNQLAGLDSEINRQEARRKEIEAGFNEFANSMKEMTDKYIKDLKTILLEDCDFALANLRAQKSLLKNEPPTSLEKKKDDPDEH